MILIRLEFLDKILRQKPILQLKSKSLLIILQNRNKLKYRLMFFFTIQYSQFFYLLLLLRTIQISCKYLTIERVYCNNLHYNRLGMILLITATIFVVSSIIVFLLKISKKLIILTAFLVIVLLINFVNEIYASKQVQNIYEKNSDLVLRSYLVEATYSSADKQNHSQILLNRNQQLINFVLKQFEKNNYFLVRFQNHHNSSALSRQIAASFKDNQNAYRLKIYEVNFANEICNLQCFKNTLSKTDETDYTIFLLHHNQNLHQLNDIYDLYFSKNISVIFLNQYPLLFHKIDKYVKVIKNGKSINKQHLKTGDESCPQTNGEIYPFYQSQHCNLTTLVKSQRRECLEQIQSLNNGKVPSSWMRVCFENAQFIEESENGWIQTREYLKLQQNNQICEKI